MIELGQGIDVGPGINIGFFNLPGFTVFIITEDDNQIITETGDALIDET